MMLTLDHRAARIAADTDERVRPRSLDLALRRLGFARLPVRFAAVARGPRTWTRGERDDALPDWRPL